jgi:cytochrome c2
VVTLLSVATVGYLCYRESRAGATYERYQQQAGVAPGVRRLSVRGLGEDRCPTCHVKIFKAGAQEKEARNPLRAHPGPYLKLHPPARFLCTACHGPGGAYLDRCLPSRRGRFMAQASCLSCHPGSHADNLPGGAVLTRGLQASRRLGCIGCHRTRALDQLLEPYGNKVGPRLDRVAAKLPVPYLRAFIAAPTRVRPGTAMPWFFMLKGAPPFTVKKIKQQSGPQVEALVAFLVSRSKPLALKQPEGGDPEAGARMFRDRGCVACHEAGKKHADLGDVGPDLSGAGARLSPGWIGAWLQAPSRYSEETRMPDLRLTAEQIGHLTAFLSAQKADDRSRGPADVDRRLADLGGELARSLGCAGCHELASVRDAEVVGPDLDGYGEKRVELLDWGGVRPEPDKQTWQRWTELKLTRPLAFDRPPGVLMMPYQELRPGELRGLLVLMRALTERSAAQVAPAPADRHRRRRRGETLVAELGCRRCHCVGGRGGAIRALWPRPSDRPPALEGEGAKVLPGWLYSFLRRPTELRPWLAMRMPTFTALGPQGARELSGYLAAVDRASYPFVQRERRRLEGTELAQAHALFDKLQCLRCHLLSNAQTLKPGELAPDLALSGERLRRSWIRRFILEPQKLMPGTRMPTLFPLADEDDPDSRITPEPGLLGGDVTRQVDALTDLNLMWREASR